MTFDPHTLFIAYAALAGCTPVLLEPPHLPASERPHWPTARPGVALGFAQVAQARAERHLLLERLAANRTHEDASVLRFAEIAQGHDWGA